MDLVEYNNEVSFYLSTQSICNLHHKIRKYFHVIAATINIYNMKQSKNKK